MESKYGKPSPESKYIKPEINTIIKLTKVQEKSIKTWFQGLCKSFDSDSKYDGMKKDILAKIPKNDEFTYEVISKAEIIPPPSVTLSDVMMHLDKNSLSCKVKTKMLNKGILLLKIVYDTFVFSPMETLTPIGVELIMSYDKYRMSCLPLCCL